jgi:hypothetical protein
MFSVGSHGAGAVSGTGTPRYYSFNRGLTHFLAFSAEAYTYHSGPEFLANQLAFMKADLAAVDRSETPWVVALVHKAWWMESEAYADFTPVLIAGGVDILFCGHWHYYNRYKPFNNVTGDVDEQSISADGGTYTNPKYMTVIITGASGDKEQDSPYDKPFPSYTGTQNCESARRFSLTLHPASPISPPPPREQLCNRYCSNKHTHPNLRGPTLTLWWPGFYQAGKATRVIRLSMRNALKASTLIATSTCSRLLTEFCRASRSTEKKRESTYMAK